MTEHRETTRIVVLMVALGASGTASAQAIDYNPVRDPALAPCDAQLYSGHRAGAMRCYSDLATSVEEPLVRAEASWATGDVKRANELFRDAVRRKPDDPQVRTRWGYLYLSTHQDQDAVALFEEALERNQEYVPALLGIATALARNFDNEAQVFLAEALALDENAIEAHLLIAQMALEEGDLAAADASLDQALQLVRERKLPALEVYALRAAWDLLQGITDSEWTGLALAENPHYGDVYATPAYFYIITRRYREAVELLRRAVEAQPELWSAHALLGINLLRLNRLDEGTRHLRIAYEGDPFYAGTVNTLRLLDSFSDFVVSRHETVLPARGATPEQQIEFRLRLHRDEAPILEPHVTRLVADAIVAFSARYGFAPREPVVVELFPSHDDFAVRVDGMPGIGLLGATFGYLVAMDSPAVTSTGNNHWGSTLWHEIAHVFTLAATEHLVPRWFSEGISVHEEWSSGPAPGITVPLPVFEAIRDGRLLPIEDLDAGFIHQTYEGQILVSYVQAGLVCEYITRQWGAPRLKALLDRFGSRRNTVEAFRDVLGVSPDGFDAGFTDFVRQRFGTMLNHFDDWRARQQAAKEALAKEDFDAAIAAAREAIRIYPDFVGTDSPHLLLAYALDEKKDEAGARTALEEYWRRGGVEANPIRRLADLLYAADRRDEAIHVLSGVNLSAPLDESLHARLGDWLLEAGRGEDAVHEFTALLSFKPHDLAGAHFRLARAYHLLPDPDKARREVLLALEVAPHYREAQQLLLELSR